MPSQVFPRALEVLLCDGIEGAAIVAADFHGSAVLEQFGVEKPNFKFDGVELRWYKYVGRGMSCNRDWNEKQWRNWFDKCLKTIRKYDVAD